MVDLLFRVCVIIVDLIGIVVPLNELVVEHRCYSLAFSF